MQRFLITVSYSVLGSPGNRIEPNLPLEANGELKRLTAVEDLKQAIRANGKY